MRADEAEPTNANGEAGKVPGETWTEETAREVLKGWKKVGGSMAAYARSLGVTPERIGWWKRRLGTASSPTNGNGGSKSVGFLQIRVRDATGAAGGHSAAPKAPAPPSAQRSAMLELVIGGSRVVRVPPDFDEVALRRLVHALEVSAC